MLNPLLNNDTPPVQQNQQASNPLLGNSGARQVPQQQLPPLPELMQMLEHNAGVSRMLTHHLSDSNVTSDKVLKSLPDLIKDGRMTAHQAAVEAAGMPVEKDKLREWLMQHFLKNAEAGKVLHRHILTKRMMGG
jgi:hypothetical protein